MSSPSPSLPSHKPPGPKMPKSVKVSQPTTNGDAQPHINGDITSGGKGKSAKELKKVKRAALVASRVPGEEGSGQSPEASTSVEKGRPGSTAGPSTVPPPMTAPRRPQNAHDRSLVPDHPTNAQSNLFVSHLPFHRPPSTSSALNSAKLHPIIVRLGVLMSSGTLRGATARTMGMMAAFKEVIRDYECPDQAVLWKDLPVYLSPMISWLEACRPKGVGGGNAIRWLKSEINRLGESGGRTEAEVRSSHLGTCVGRRF